MSDEQPKLITPECLLGNFPCLFTPGKPNDSGVAYYEADLLFSPEAQKTPEFARLVAASKAASKEKWGADLPDNHKMGIRKASSKRRQKDNSPYYPEDEFPGFVLMSVKSKNKPGVVDQLVQPIIDDTEIYGGCKVRVSVHPFAYSTKGNNGVSFWMNNVQKLGDGKAIGGGRGPRAEDEFTPVGGADIAGDAVDSMFD